jgi:hypothetical protein
MEFFYLEGKVQLKHFYKKQSKKHILCSQSNNAMARPLFPTLKPFLLNPGKSLGLSWQLVKAEKVVSAGTFHRKEINQLNFGYVICLLFHLLFIRSHLTFILTPPHFILRIC